MVEAAGERTATTAGRPPSFIRKAVRTLSEFGWIDGTLYGLRRLLDRSGGRISLNKYHLVAQPVPDAPLLPPRRGRSIEIRPLGPDDPAHDLLGREQPVVRYRFDQDSVAFGAFKDGDPVGCLWLRLGPYDEDEVRCRYVPEPQGEAAWDFDVFVAPEHRGGLVFVRLWDAANSYLRERGVRWSMSRISAFNRTSLTAHGRLESRRIGQAIFIGVGSWQLMMATVPPFLHLSSAPERPPVLRLPAPRDAPAGDA